MEAGHQDRIYLPSQSDGVDAKEYLLRYVEREFPESSTNGGDVGDGVAVYSVPRKFQKMGEDQAVSAEHRVFDRLHGLRTDPNLRNTWITFFHSASYAGHSHRNKRDGKLMIREHDFVIFVKSNGKCFVALAEVKSTHDENANVKNLEYTSNAKVIKNNKRSAQHQLRDHLEILLEFLDISPEESNIQTYIMWPFLGSVTKDPKRNVVRRWKDEPDLHIFEGTLMEQENFNVWFRNNVISNDKAVSAEYFVRLLNRYILLSCGVFVDEINEGMLALLNQEQLEILNSNTCHATKGGPLVVHGAAGTGKTLLVLKKLEQLHKAGQLNAENRALYLCFWPGIRCEVEQKLEALKIRQYVDTGRFYISLSSFLNTNKSNYKHIFMDEAEAICLSFEKDIMTSTMATIFRKYHAGNCIKNECNHQGKSCYSANWGELWFLVDMHQASLFLPKLTPQLFRKPSIVLNKVMRSTGCVFNMFKHFYMNPMPKLPQEILNQINIPCISLGHEISGPSVCWVNTDYSNGRNGSSPNSGTSLNAIVKVIIDLCATKGFKPNDICVIPFLLNECYRPQNFNVEIDSYFVENGFRPRGIGEIEDFIVKKQTNDFLVSWVLKVKGIEFKVVILVIDEDDYDLNDSEDRKKTYIMSSRCTCLLVIVSSSETKKKIDLNDEFRPYPFHIDLD
ncbi:hypothetical protein Trydic_g21298 [Trypoxylus dichotomus]